MKIEEALDYLRRRHPPFGFKVMYDEDNKGNEFCEIIYPNKNIPTMPIAVSVSEAGCLVSVGQFSNVTGDYPISPEQAADAIDDIVSDKIVFVLGFSDDKDIGSGAPFYTRLFALTGAEDDMQTEFDSFVSKISTPVTGFKRKLTRLKGRFVISNFSGSVRRTVNR